MREGLIEEISEHYRDLAPHIKDRKSSVLLKEALDELEKFSNRHNNREVMNEQDHGTINKLCGSGSVGERVMLPCPFCNGKAEIERMGTNRASMIITCTDCGCTLETGETWIDENSSWNTRAT